MQCLNLVFFKLKYEHYEHLSVVNSSKYHNFIYMQHMDQLITLSSWKTGYIQKLEIQIVPVIYNLSMVTVEIIGLIFA